MCPPGQLKDRRAAGRRSLTSRKKGETFKAAKELDSGVFAVHRVDPFVQCVGFEAEIKSTHILHTQ